MTDPIEQAHETYRSYLLKLWYEPTERQDTWRAVLQDVLTREELYFKNIDALIQYLSSTYNDCGDPTQDMSE